MITRSYIPLLVLLELFFIAIFLVHQPLPSHAETSAGDALVYLSSQQSTISEAPIPKLVSFSPNSSGFNLVLFLSLAEEESFSADEKRFQELPYHSSLSNTVSQAKNSTTPLLASIVHPSNNYQIIRHLLTVRMLH